MNFLRMTFGIAYALKNKKRKQKKIFSVKKTKKRKTLIWFHIFSVKVEKQPYLLEKIRFTRKKCQKS